VWTADGSKFESKYIISAMPQAIINRVTFVPPLPALKLQLIQRIPMGSIIKTMTFYDKAYWREKGLSGQMATDCGPVLYCVDDCKPDGSAPCIMGFILADQVSQTCSVDKEVS
jgi:monoamine oxidase